MFFCSKKNHVLENKNHMLSVFSQKTIVCEPVTNEKYFWLLRNILTQDFVDIQDTYEIRDSYFETSTSVYFLSERFLNIKKFLMTRRSPTRCSEENINADAN